eukprot:scaffold35584_cov71-Cyclotella_meneghiniana.AAC.3
MDIMNDATWLRLDPPDLKGLNRLTLEPRVGRRLYMMLSPFSIQLCVLPCHTNQMTFADAYHCCIMDIMNDATCLRLDPPDLKGLNGLTLEPELGEDYT